MSKERENKNNNNNNHSWKPREKDEYYKLRAWGILLYGLIGAAATTLAVCQLRRSGDWFYSQQSKSQSFSSWRSGASQSGWASYREEAWKRYNHRMQQEYKQEMERVERIRRMQNIFNRERNKYKRSYERWREYGPGAYQHYREDEWYWRTDTSYRDDSTDYRFTPTYGGNNSMSHHYSVLGLDRSRAEPYSDAEIKVAFRAVAMKYHPDQNQGDTEAAETKFKEVMESYEAIKLERRKNVR